MSSGRAILSIEYHLYDVWYSGKIGFIFCSAQSSNNSEKQAVDHKKSWHSETNCRGQREDFNRFASICLMSTAPRMAT